MIDESARTRPLFEEPSDEIGRTDPLSGPKRVHVRRNVLYDKAASGSAVELRTGDRTALERSHKVSDVERGATPERASTRCLGLAPVVLI